MFISSLDTWSWSQFSIVGSGLDGGLIHLFRGKFVDGWMSVERIGMSADDPEIPSPSLIAVVEDLEWLELI